MHEIELLGALPFIVLFSSFTMLGVLFVSFSKGDQLLFGCGVAFLCTIPMWFSYCIYVGLCSQLIMRCRYCDNEERNIAYQFETATLPLWQE